MMKRIIPMILLAGLLLLPACAAAREVAPQTYNSEAPAVGAPAAPEPAGSSGQDAFGNVTSSSVPSAQAQTDRLVIKNGSLSIVVDDPVKSMDNITSLADELGGFVVSANQTEETLESGDKAPRASITIRVPAARFNEALTRIKQESKQLPLNETINSQDVTKEYTDLQSRLRNAEAAEKQLSDIMAEAIRTEDVLSVYNQLVQVREQIEVLKGQIQFYEQSAAMSAIDVQLTANAAVQPLTIGGWQPVGVAKDAVQTLINTLKVVGNLVIWVILYILPVLLVLYLVFVLPISLVIRAWRRRHPRVKVVKSTSITPPAPPSQPAK
jgi:hypothetical protein